MRTPFLLVNFKAYPEALGTKGIDLARACAQVAESSGRNLGVAPSAFDLALVAKSVRLPVFAQHLDPVEAGQATGWLPPEAALADVVVIDPALECIEPQTLLEHLATEQRHLDDICAVLPPARRSWLLLTQLLVMVGLMAMASVTPSQLGLFVGLTLLVAFAGATLDIAVDAYRIEIAPVEAQGALVATYSLGYRLALIVTGALALVLADHAIWPNVYRVMAACMLIPVVANLMAREPEVLRIQVQSWSQGF